MIRRLFDWWRRSRWERRLYVLSRELETATVPELMEVLGAISAALLLRGAPSSSGRITALAALVARELRAQESRQ